MPSHLTQEQANQYLHAALGDELSAAISLAIDRSDDDTKMPEGIEIHHALFLLRQPFDLPAPSWEDTRVELRDRNIILPCKTSSALFIRQALSLQRST